ncbi:MAG: aminotransferase class III-fold pyridoxal phosphate-dependent enzyme [Phycisphaerales bacterium]|nr:aminotransferase class III-fold pyridoxal phosphate-dependent enzyme [Phycisphaerales bacterium]
MTTDSTHPGLYPALANSETDSAIASILAQIDQAQQTLAGVKGPDPDLIASSEPCIDQFARERGRGLFFPVMGAGLGRGALVAMTDGSVKYDFITGIGVHSFGHGDLDLIRTALLASMSDAVMQGNLQCNADAAAFSALLVESAAPDRLKHCFLTNSGALSNENALKICMQHTGGAARVLTFEHCFAGRTTTMCQIGDSAGGRQGIPLNTDVDYLPFYDQQDPEGSTARTIACLDEFLRRYPSQHSCFMMELVQGEGGFNTAPREFWIPLLDRAREAGVPIWFDEVQSFGRTEELFQFQALDLAEYADVVTLGKMSQVCATLYTEALNPKPGLLSATFIGSTAALQVGRRIIERLRSGDSYGPDGRHARLHATFRRLAGTLLEAHPECFPSRFNPGQTADLDEIVGGTGGMMRLTPYGGEGSRVKPLIMRLLDAGVMAFTCGHGPFHLRFLPPVGVLQDADIEAVMEIVDSVLEDES